MKRSSSEITIDWNDNDLWDIEHNKQIKRNIENLTKQFRIKNKTKHCLNFMIKILMYYI